MDLRLPTPAGELTRAEQKILDYINTNTDTFLFSSIGQLAQRLEISNATVSRFARHVGCRDFKALKSMVLEQSFVGRTCLPAEDRADISLFAYRGTEKEYHSMAAPAALLDALAVAVAERLGTEGTERLQSLHRMKKDYFPDG